MGRVLGVAALSLYGMAYRILVIPVQLLLITVAMVGFNQEWHVEEERPIGAGEDYGAGAPPENGAPQPA